MIHGCDLTIHKDQDISLTYSKLNTQRVLATAHQRLWPQVYVSKGDNNNLAEFLSRLPIAEGKETPGPYGPAQGHQKWRNRTRLTRCLSWTNVLDPLTLVNIIPQYSMTQCYSDLTTEAYRDLPLDRGPNPIDYMHLENEQQRQEALLQQLLEFDPTRAIDVATFWNHREGRAITLWELTTFKSFYWTN